MWPIVAGNKDKVKGQRILPPYLQFLNVQHGDVAGVVQPPGAPRQHRPHERRRGLGGSLVLGYEALRPDLVGSQQHATHGTGGVSDRDVPAMQGKGWHTTLVHQPHELNDKKKQGGGGDGDDGDESLCESESE